MTGAYDSTRVGATYEDPWLTASPDSKDATMKSWLCGLAGLLVALCVPFQSTAQQASPSAVKTLSPGGAITPTGTWSLGSRAGDFMLVAGMRGIDPRTNALVSGGETAGDAGISEHAGDRRIRGCVAS